MKKNRNIKFKNYKINRYFIKKNKIIMKKNGQTIISNVNMHLLYVITK